GTLVAVYLHRNEVFIHNGRNFRIVVRLAVHHMAPVTPHRANVEQHRLVLALRGSEGFISPLMPLDGLVHSGSQVGGGSAGEGVERGGGHASSLYARRNAVRGLCTLAANIPLGSTCGYFPFPSFRACGRLDIRARLRHQARKKPVKFEPWVRVILPLSFSSCVCPPLVSRRILLRRPLPLPLRSRIWKRPSQITLTAARLHRSRPRCPLPTLLPTLTARFRRSRCSS